ncbi:hypothetical protein GF359_08040, partial [candidate division WOR-3 bacterium]|nr:hypothetical protein [candidate division WOR-3 bacterium]MBD3365150.1 hypothetical protein [candidate division WOR-3 bacterium]
MNQAIVNKEFVSMLHQAHADSIESAYMARMSVDGNPDDVKILDIDGARVFLSREPWSWSNRAILSGNETSQTIDKVVAEFEKHGTQCHI